ncbi:MAG: hypothetical protein WKF81_02570 [Thermomicrobiales bacterium]
MTTMLITGLIVIFGALYAAMAVTPMAIEEMNSEPDGARPISSPVVFERQLPRIAPETNAEAA